MATKAAINVDFGRLKEYFPLFGTPFYGHPLNTSSSLDSAQVTKYLKNWFLFGL